LEDFVVFIQTQFDIGIKVIRSDNGTEFFMTNFFSNKGIIHQTSCVNTPQQNSIVERKHGHVARALMIQSHLPKIYWSYSVIHSAHIINMLPTPVLNDFSPHEMLYKTPQDFNQLKVFGSLCYGSTLSTNRSKFDPRASKCVFIGFKKGTKGYILFNIQSRVIFVSRDVVFYEHIFPYQRVEDTSNETENPDIHDQIFFTEDQPILNKPSQVIFTPCDNIENNVNDDHKSDIQIPEEVCSHREQNLNENHETTQSIRMSARPKTPLEYLKDYHCNLNVYNTSSRVKYPLNFVLSYDKLSPSYKPFVMSISSHVESNIYSEAVKYDCWRKAIQCEISALESNQTWEIVLLLKNKTAIGCKWVFKIKSTIRLLLSLASIYNWELKQLDINNVFLHGELKEDVYMVALPGLASIQPRQVCKLKKALYGLKQAGREWFVKLSSFFISVGYTQSMNDYSLFINSSEGSFTTLLVHVDDIILAGNDKEEIDRVKEALNKTFKIKDLSDLRYFLGFEVARSKKGIMMNQRKYPLKLLIDADLLAYKPTVTPMDNLVKLSSTGRVPFTYVHAYRRLIGRLMYLTNIRPDIRFSVQQLSQFLDKPTIAHYNATIRILKYIKGAPSLGFL